MTRERYLGILKVACNAETVPLNLYIVLPLPSLNRTNGPHVRLLDEARYFQRAPSLRPSQSTREPQFVDRNAKSLAEVLRCHTACALPA